MPSVTPLEFVTKRIKILTIVINKKELEYSDITFINNYLTSKKYDFFINFTPNKNYEEVYTIQSIYVKGGFNIYPDISYDVVYSKDDSSSYFTIYRTAEFIKSRFKNYDSDKVIIFKKSNKELEQLQLDIIFNESDFLYIRNYVNTHLHNINIDKDVLNNLTILTDINYKVELKNWYHKMRLKVYLKTNLKVV